MSDKKDECEKCPAKPKIAKPTYKRCQLEPNQTYLYCTCGFSKDQPFCDQICQNDPNIKGWKPLPFSVDVKQYGGWAMCLCKRSKSQPFCDGSHIEITDW